MPKMKGLLALLAKPEGGAEDDAEDAAKDILEAVKDDDAKALSLALKAHYEACEMESGDEEEDEEY